MGSKYTWIDKLDVENLPRCKAYHTNGAPCTRFISDRGAVYCYEHKERTSEDKRKDANLLKKHRIGFLRNPYRVLDWVYPYELPKKQTDWDYTRIDWWVPYSPYLHGAPIALTN